MDAAKAQRLKAELAAQGDTPLVQIERFFDGNDDEGSIGCNLLEHPGIDAFRNALVGLTRRALDPGEDSWPCTDAVEVISKISPADPEGIWSQHKGNVSVAWWD